MNVPARFDICNVFVIKDWPSALKGANEFGKRELVWPKPQTDVGLADNFALGIATHAQGAIVKIQETALGQSGKANTSRTGLEDALQALLTAAQLVFGSFALGNIQYIA